LFADVVNGADIWMVQRRRRLGFALKTGEGLRVASYVFGEKFERDKAMQPRVLGFINDAHPPAAQPLDDAVVRDDLANHWRESYVCKTCKSMKPGGYTH
jgi:hypothetical protein